MDENETIVWNNTRRKKRRVYRFYGLYNYIIGNILICKCLQRRKFNTGGGTQTGGADDGILNNTVSSVSSTGFGTLTLYVGILVIILNVITNTFRKYLRNKRKIKKINY